VSAPVGADIESICGKCGDVWHVVVAKVGERIARVQCKQCGSQHRHRPPGGAPAGRREPTSRPPHASRPAPAAPELPPFDPSRPPLPYHPQHEYRPGDRIAHPSFGIGVVARSEPGKVQVVFGTGPRVLAQAKPASTLAPPAKRPPEEEA
jgi:hypothetical protein